jgi:hypothetical protein
VYTAMEWWTKIHLEVLRGETSLPPSTQWARCNKKPQEGKRKSTGEVSPSASILLKFLSLQTASARFCRTNSVTEN